MKELGAIVVKVGGEKEEEMDQVRGAFLLFISFHFF